MNIALFVPSWPPGFISNGIVTYASQLVPALRRLGHNVFILTPRKETRDDDPFTIDLCSYASPATLWHRVRYRFAPAATRFNATSFSIVTAIKELIEKHNVDVFEMEESGGRSFAVSRLKLLPVVVRLHGPWFLNGRFDDPGEKTPQNYPRQKWEGRGIQNADIVTSPSAEVLRAVKEHYNLRLAASRVIPNPIESKDEAETWNVETCNGDNILFVGRFDRRKGGDLVLRVFANLAAACPRLRLTFVGRDRGVIGADGKIWSFERFVRSYLPDWCRARIDFYREMKQSDVMPLRAKHFATIIASQYEIMPYTVLEAMSLGCPLVATSVGGIPELIQDRRNGLLVPSQDVDAMTIACKKLLDDHALAARLGRQAWHDSRNSYSPDNIAKQTISAYEEAINKFKIHNTVVVKP